MSFSNFDDAKPGKVTLYDFPKGAYPARVRIALHEKNLIGKLDFVFIDLLKGDHKTEAFRTKNYSRTVPVLEFEDGTIVLECVALTQYIDNIDGKPALTGTTPLEQGLIHMWTSRVQNEFLEPFNLYIHNGTPGLGPNVEENQNKEWGLHQREKGLKGMRFFDNLLKSRPFIAGDKFSMADAAAIGAMIFLDFVNEEVPKELDGLLAWYERVHQVPSVRAYFDLIKDL